MSILSKDLVGDIMKYVGTTILSADVVDYIDRGGNMAYIAINPHPSAVDIVINPKNYNLNSRNVRKRHILSSSNNNQILRFIIARPWLINYHQFSELDNDIAVRYLLSVIKNIAFDDSDSDSDDDEFDDDDNYEYTGSYEFYTNILSRLEVNPNKLAVQYFINNPNMISDKFQLNTNPDAIEFLKNNPIYRPKYPMKYKKKTTYTDAKTLINKTPQKNIRFTKHTCNLLAEDTSDVAVDYILANIGSVIGNAIFRQNFVKNTNDKVFDCIMSNYSRFSDVIRHNTNIRMVKFINTQNFVFDDQEYKVFSNPDIFVRDPELEKVLLTV